MNYRKIFFAVFCLYFMAQLPLYAQTGEGSFNVKSFGALGDGHTTDTKSFTAAITACVKAGGGTVYVPAGKFMIGTVQLFSNINLMLSSGAVLVASPNRDDFLLQKDYGFSGSGAGDKLGILFATHAENVSITGSGVIDGNAKAFMYDDSVQVNGDDLSYTRQGKSYLDHPADNKEAPIMWKGQGTERPGTQVIFQACKKVNVRDITIRNANDWSVDIKESDNVKIIGISIDNDQRVPNSDGIDMYDSQNVLIANCDIRAGDDGIACIGSSNITVNSCNCTSRSCGIRVGYNVFNDHDSGNLLFNNIRIYGANRGIGLFQRRKGNMSNMLFSNIIIDSRLYPGQWWGHGEPIHISAIPGAGHQEVGTISHVRFSNIIATGEHGIVLLGSKESVLQDISFDHVQLTINNGKFTAINGGNFDLRPANDVKATLFKHDIPAVYASKINNLTIRDMDIHWDPLLPSWFTNAIYCDHFDQLTIDGLTASAGPKAAANEAVVSLHNGHNVSLDHIKLQTDGTKSPVAIPHQLILQENISNRQLQ
jgi:polygalacturonase